MIPCALDEAARALAVNAAEIHTFRALPLLVGHFGGIFSGHARRGQPVQIEPLLERLRHRAIARNVRGGAQLHGGVIGNDENVAGLGDEQRAEAWVARNLLQIRTGVSRPARSKKASPRREPT